MKKILVCAKQVADPEGPPASFELNSQGTGITASGLAPVISPFDENALEAAIRLKDSTECRITVLSTGKKLSDTVFRKLLASGADEVFLCEDEIHEKADSFAATEILYRIIRSIGDFDIIFTGRQSSDWNSGITGRGLAELFSVPCISLAKKVEISENFILAERVLPEGYEQVKTAMPCVITVSNELGDLRYAGIKQIKDARQKPLTRISGEQISEIPENRIKTIRLYKPLKERNCIFISGESGEEAGYALAERLLSDRVLQ